MLKFKFRLSLALIACVPSIVTAYPTDLQLTQALQASAAAGAATHMLDACGMPESNLSGGIDLYNAAQALGDVYVKYVPEKERTANVPFSRKAVRDAFATGTTQVANFAATPEQCGLLQDKVAHLDSGLESLAIQMNERVARIKAQRQWIDG